MWIWFYGTDPTLKKIEYFLTTKSGRQSHLRRITGRVEVKTLHRPVGLNRSPGTVVVYVTSIKSN